MNSRIAPMRQGAQAISRTDFPEIGQGSEQSHF